MPNIWLTRNREKRESKFSTLLKLSQMYGELSKKVTSDQLAKWQAYFAAKEKSAAQS